MEKLGLECKKLMAKEIKKRLEASSNLFITSFSGLPVPDQDRLRSKLRELDAAIFIVKNRIAQKVFQELKLESLPLKMQGLTALALGGKDVILLSKALIDFVNKFETFKILGGYVDEQTLDFNSVKRLASIPSKEALLAQIVWGCKYPIQGLVNTLSATIRNFVVILDRIKEKK